MVGLLAFTQAISQADKAVVGLAAEHIMADLSLSAAQYGLVAGSLFALFAAGGLFVAFAAAPRFRPRNILIVMLLVWSLSQLPVVFAASLTVLILCRLILGAGEGAAAPTCMNICHEWFPDDRRALPSAAVLFGSNVGFLVSAPALTWVIYAFGWRAAFLACSICGFVALGLWLLAPRDGPFVARRGAGVPVGAWSRALRELVDETIIGVTIVGFCGFWIVGFTVAWLAPYVRVQVGFSLIESGWVLSAIYLGHALLMLVVAAVSQKLISQGVTSRRARGFITAGCLLASSLCFLMLTQTHGSIGRLLLMATATAFAAVVFPILAILISEVAPPAERYRLMTIVMSLVTISAPIGPAVAGASIKSVGGDWFPALLTLSAVGLMGALAGFFLINPESTLAKAARASEVK